MRRITKYADMLAMSFSSELSIVLGDHRKVIAEQNLGMALREACPTRSLFDAESILRKCYILLFGSCDMSNATTLEIMEMAWAKVRVAGYNPRALGLTVH